MADSSTRMDASVGKLSSGLRITRASDDAAGLSISEKLRTQFLGLSKASRNAMDGLSLIGTADGALGVIGDLLQKGRELSVKAANGTLDASERNTIQAEIAFLLEEINRISDTTTFNDRRLFSAGGGAAATAAVLEGLRSGWLEQAEQVIQNHLGLIGDGATITVSLGSGGPKAGWITGNPDINGKLQDIKLHFDAAQLTRTQDADRVVARTLTQAVLARNSNFSSLEQWFISGLSDLISGGDETLYQAVNSYSVNTIVNAMAGAWSSDTLHEASAYAAMKYLNAVVTGFGGTMADIMNSLQSGADLNTALSVNVGMNVAGFISDFQLNGSWYINTLIAGGDLSDPDVGGLHPGNSSSVIPDGGSYSNNPTVGFTIGWDASSSQLPPIILQVGANGGDKLTIEIPTVDTASLDLIGLNVVVDAGKAITRFNQAITKVTTIRASLGSKARSLEHVINSNIQAELAQRESASRIVDVDYAKELTSLTKEQLLLTSSSSMLKQANSMRQNIGWLLNGLRRASPVLPRPSPAPT